MAVQFSGNLDFNISDLRCLATSSHWVPTVYSPSFLPSLSILWLLGWRPDRGRLTGSSTRCSPGFWSSSCRTWFIAVWQKVKIWFLGAGVQGKYLISLTQFINNSYIWIWNETFLHVNMSYGRSLGQDFSIRARHCSQAITSAWPCLSRDRKGERWSGLQTVQMKFFSLLPKGFPCN